MIRAPSAKLSRTLGFSLAAALVVGVVVRLVWPDDIHFLGDEAWTLRKVQHVHGGGDWPLLGMPTSRGPKNAPVSVWIFILLGNAFGGLGPASLTRIVGVAGIVARAVALVIPRWLVRDEDERRQWFWAIALSSLNPTLVFLERQIWPPSLFPILMTVLVIGFLKRDTRAGAIAWGACGALAGQIQGAGFFFAPALALFTKVFADRRQGASAGPRDARETGRTRWGAWLLGSGLGALPALPWLLYLVRERPHASGSPWWLRFRLEFYQYFFSDPTGLGGEFILGKDVWSAMKYPLVFGTPSYLVGVAHVGLAIVSALLGVATLRLAWAHVRAGTWRNVVRGGASDTALLLAATLGGMGVLMTLPSIPIHRQYMLATFPLQYVFVARVALARGTRHGEKLLAALLVGTAIVSFGFLSFLRTTGESEESGKTYATQLREGIGPEAAKKGGAPHLDERGPDHGAVDAGALDGGAP